MTAGVSPGRPVGGHPCWHRAAPAAVAVMVVAALTLGACGRDDDGGPTLPGSFTIQGSVLTVPDTLVVPEPTRP